METKKQKIEQIQNLKDMKNKYLNRKVEFWISGYPNSLYTYFSDGNLQENKNIIIVGGKKNKLVDLLLDTAINYLEQELKEKINEKNKNNNTLY